MTPSRKLLAVLALLAFTAFCASMITAGFFIHPAAGCIVTAFLFGYLFWAVTSVLKDVSK